MALVVIVLLASAAWAVAGTVGTKAATAGLLRVAYLAPATPNVDIYLDGVRSTTNVTYQTITTYVPVTPGAHTVAVRQMASSPSSPAVAQTSLTIGANERWTVVVGGQWSALQMGSFQDATASPPSGKAEVRFLHTALQVPGVDVAVKNGPVVFHDVSFMHASSYAAVNAGPYVLQLKATGTREVLFTAPQITVSAGQVETLVGVGGVGVPVQLLTLNDAAAAGTAPAGGADTGGGGTSPAMHTAEVVAALLLLGVILMIGVSYVTARRRTSGVA
ncbi:MAG: DUF4397 domain-containing protein [Candidatus Dormibacteraceae bacterium]